MKYALAVVLLSVAAFSQTKPADPLESAWNVAINGNFSNITSAANNNGVQTVEAFRVAQHWNLRADQFLTMSPNAVIATAGPEYRLSLAHILAKSNFAANASKLEGFANVGLGTARTQTTDASGTSTLSAARFAYKAGGGIDVLVNNTLSLRLLDVSYVRASMLAKGGQVLGNHLNLEAGLGLRF